MTKIRVSAALFLCFILLCSIFPLLCSAEEVPSVTGRIIEIEKYGHAALDITAEDFGNAGFSLGDIVTVSAGSYTGDMPYFNGYYVDPGEAMLLAYPGKENIAVCINYGRFADTAGVDVGSEVCITLKEKAGALLLQEISNLVYTNQREDYPSDEVFANFRPVVLGNIAEGKLYRSASPVDNFYNRARYADALARAAGVNAVMNLASTEEEMSGYFKEEDFASDYCRVLYGKGRIITLGLPVNFDSSEFAQGIVRGFTFLAGQDPPYLVHCTEGKDRAGFASMVLEALMGAAKEEIISDYMLSYVNYYGIEPGTEKFNSIIEKNIIPMLRIVSGTDALDAVDLAEAAEAYLLKNGMEKEALDALRHKLSSVS